jgi:hypothetical protein
MWHKTETRGRANHGGHGVKRRRLDGAAHLSPIFPLDKFPQIWQNPK